MMSKLSTPMPKSSATRFVRAGVVGLATLAAGAALATGCLDRPVVPAQPGTSNVFVDQIIQSAVDKIDLLFMIDNSTSMADKQNILAAAVPQMVNRLVTPICVDGAGAPVGGSVDATGRCANGTPEFAPIKDIHIAIVTSSLGSHGGDVCTTATNGNDNGQALGSVRTGLAQWSDTGFLAWDPTGMKNTPPGNETVAATLTTDFTNQVVGAAQVGCGYEASLEAWYRFLIDPEPPLTVVHDTTSNLTVKQGINATLLKQRSMFLRADSLVAIVMLSDENDCSILDAGFGWFVSTRTLNGNENRMPRATSACEANANSPCCMSCGDASPPAAGCTAPAADMNCQVNSGQLSAADDSVALRCWDTKRRFGFDLLYPTQRYSNALKSPTICPDSTGYLAGGCPSGAVVNPLFDPMIGTENGATGKPGTGAREPTLIFLSAIVGVPWQDLADDTTRTAPNALRYLTFNEMTAASPNRWTAILGDPTNPNGPILPSDPFMVETFKDRTTIQGLPQANPVMPDAQHTLVPATSMDPQANVINGHEQNVAAFDDLQYACIFPLGAGTKTCMPGEQACDCSPSTAATGALDTVKLYNSPLCNPPGTATQTYAKGYPGLRFMKVLYDFGENSIPASICPKVTDNTQADYGYNPAVAAIINRLKEALQGKCLPRPLDAEQVIDPNTGASTGTAVPCEVIEAKYQDPSMGACPPCENTPGRTTPNEKIGPAVIEQMQQHSQCDVGGRACANFCLCEIKQETGAAEDACRKDPIGAASTIPPGYCYISNKDVGKACGTDADCTTGTCTAGACAASTALSKCPANQQQLLGFVNGVDGTGASVPTPALGAIGFIACLGASISGTAADGG